MADSNKWLWTPMVGWDVYMSCPSLNHQTVTAGSEPLCSEKCTYILVYFLPDCMTQRQIHQTARVLWPRPTHHQSACYRGGDTRSARSNIWANTARQTDPTMHWCICEHDHTHIHTALKEIRPSVCSLKCQYFYSLYPCLHAPWPKVFCQRSRCISNWTDMIFFFRIHTNLI